MGRAIIIPIVFASFLLNACSGGEQTSISITPSKVKSVPTQTTMYSLALTPSPALTEVPTEELVVVSTNHKEQNMDLSASKFLVVFIRDDNLWITDVDTKSEFQLTQLVEGWRTISFAISPRGTRLAYTPYEGPESLDASIKILEISSGKAVIEFGDNDRYSECCVSWLDEDVIVYTLQPGQVSGFPKEPYPSVYHFEAYRPIILNLETGEHFQTINVVSIWRSPDGKYELVCKRNYPLEGKCDYFLQDLTTGQQWQIAETVGWGSFIGWSGKRNTLLFNAFDRSNFHDIQLVLVNPETMDEMVITPEGKIVGSARWSPDGSKIAYTFCDKLCEIWLFDSVDGQTQQIPTDESFYVTEIAWSPDGKQVLFYKDEDRSTLWSIEQDGSNMVKLIENAHQYLVVPNTTE